jgi:hypothetical protein
MKWIRQIHLYLGVFLIPMIIFFALSGSLQIFRLQESLKGSTDTPPSWIVWAADVHKDQRASHEPGAPRSTPMKWLLVLMSLGLITTSILGIYLAFKYNRDKRVVFGLIFLGLVVPLTLLYL